MTVSMTMAMMRLVTMAMPTSSVGVAIRVEPGMPYYSHHLAWCVFCLSQTRQGWWRGYQWIVCGDTSPLGGRYWIYNSTKEYISTHHIFGPIMWVKMMKRWGTRPIPIDTCLANIHTTTKWSTCVINSPNWTNHPSTHTRSITTYNTQEDEYHITYRQFGFWQCYHLMHWCIDSQPACPNQFTTNG